MYLLNVADYSGMYGCGHIYIVCIERCVEAAYRVDQALCVTPQERVFKRRSETFNQLVRWFRPVNARLTGFCPLCQSQGRVNRF